MVNVLRFASILYRSSFNRKAISKGHVLIK